MRQIFISSGHSTRQGRDRGASGNGFIEGVEAAEFRKLLVIELQKLGQLPIVDVDNSILSETLAFFRNKTKNDSIVLDIHFNSGPVTATGTETLIPINNTEFELNLARSLSRIMATTLDIPLRGNYAGMKGVKSELESHHGRLGWMRLNGENVLIEICFISNPNDMKKYQQNKQTLAKEMAKIISNFSIGVNDDIYTVQKGDTLSIIARKFNISLDNLLFINNLSMNDIIRIGQKIKIK
jgi:N-acetylmuramoyl-L-alanine amidase